MSQSSINFEGVRTVIRDAIVVERQHTRQLVRDEIVTEREYTRQLIRDKIAAEREHTRQVVREELAEFSDSVAKLVRMLEEDAQAESSRLSTDDRRSKTTQSQLRRHLADHRANM